MCGESATCRCSQCYEDHVNREVAGTADTRVAVEREIVKWLRMTPTARKVAISIHSSQDIARLADAIERGEHRKPAKEGGVKGGIEPSSPLPPWVCIWNGCGLYGVCMGSVWRLYPMNPEITNEPCPWSGAVAKWTAMMKPWAS